MKKSNFKKNMKLFSINKIKCVRSLTERTYDNAAMNDLGATKDILSNPCSTHGGRCYNSIIKIKSLSINSLLNEKNDTK